jgi:excisionase family DNA binding protein
MNSRANTNSQIHTTIKGLVPPSERGSGASSGRGSHAAPVSFALISSSRSVVAKNDAERLAYRIREAAEKIGVGLTTMRALIKSGEIRVKRFGKTNIVVPHSSLEKFLTKN